MVLIRLLKARLKVLLKVLIRLLKARLKVLLKVLIRLLRARPKVLLKVLIRLLKARLKAECGYQGAATSVWLLVFCLSLGFCTLFSGF